MKKLSFIICTLAAILLVRSCGFLNPEPALQSITVSPSSADLEIGEEIQLQVTFSPEGLNPAVQWESLNPTIAAVSGSGRVTGISEGRATIKATASGKESTCAITVRRNVIDVRSIKVYPITVSLPVGQTKQMIAEIYPDNATDQEIVWTSSDPLSASIDSKGVITAKKKGHGRITATAGGKSGSADFSVYNPVSSVSLEPAEATINCNDKLQLKLVTEPSDATVFSVSWYTSDVDVASVSHEGVVEGKSGGKTVITVDADGVKATCNITVLQGVGSVTLDKNTLLLNKGETYKLTATITPSDYLIDNNIKWSSTDESVATVDDTGLVTCTGSGRAVISVTAGGKSATCTVDGRVPVESVVLDTDAFDLAVGETRRLTATLLPSDATIKAATWSSSNSSIASVDQGGNVKGLKAGTVTITAKADNASASCTVTVLQNVTSVKLNKTSLSLNKGETFQLVATLTPNEYLIDSKVVWSSSEPSVASVDDTGLVTCTGSGKAVITAAVGGKSATCSVDGYVPVKQIELDSDSFEIGIGETRQITASVSPSDATTQMPKWTSSSTSIATVDSKGNVKGVKVGTVTITASADGVTATCSVSVTNKVTSLTLNATTLKLRQGETFQFTATVKPTTATYKDVTWAVSDKTVATIDENGLLTAKAEGDVTVTASVRDGLTAECAVTVSNKTGGGGHEGTGEEVWY